MKEYLMRVLREAETIPDNTWHLALVTELLRKRMWQWVSMEQVKSELDRMVEEGIIDKKDNEYIYIEKENTNTAKRKIITYLKKHKKMEIKVSDLVNIVGVSKSSVYKIIRELESDGIVEIVKRKPKTVKLKKLQ